MMQFLSYHSGSSGNLYQLKGASGNLLIEAGVPISKIKKALDFKLSSISACLCSHSHGDHSQALPNIARTGIPVYLTAETASALNLNGHRANIITPLKQFEVAGFKVLPFPVVHDVPNVGFLISDGSDKLLFLTDTFYSRYRFQGLTIIALEVNYSKETIAPDISQFYRQRLYKSHMSLENAKKLLQANDLSKVREIHLIHISKTNADPEYFKSEIQKATGRPVYINGII